MKVLTIAALVSIPKTIAAKTGVQSIQITGHAEHSDGLMDAEEFGRHVVKEISAVKSAVVAALALDVAKNDAPAAAGTEGAAD